MFDRSLIQIALPEGLEPYQVVNHNNNPPTVVDFEDVDTSAFTIIGGVYYGQFLPNRLKEKAIVTNALSKSDLEHALLAQKAINEYVQNGIPPVATLFDPTIRVLTPEEFSEFTSLDDPNFSPKRYFAAKEEGTLEAFLTHQSYGGEHTTTMIWDEFKEFYQDSPISKYVPTENQDWKAAPYDQEQAFLEAVFYNNADVIITANTLLDKFKTLEDEFNKTRNISIFESMIISEFGYTRSLATDMIKISLGKESDFENENEFAEGIEVEIREYLVNGAKDEINAFLAALDTKEPNAKPDLPSFDQ